MKTKEDLGAWIKRGQQRIAVARVLRKPMIGSEICAAARRLTPRIQLRDVTFHLKQMRQRRLVYCLNPRQVTGKLYFFTDAGRRLMRSAFGLRIVPEDLAVDYSKYSFVIRASIRKAIIREMDLLERRNPHGIRISRLRKALNERHPIGVNPVSHAVRDLIKAGVLKSLPVNKTRTRHAFRLAYPGRKILSEMNR